MLWQRSIKHFQKSPKWPSDTKAIAPLLGWDSHFIGVFLIILDLQSIFKGVTLYNNWVHLSLLQWRFLYHSPSVHWQLTRVSSDRWRRQKEDRDLRLCIKRGWMFTELQVARTAGASHRLHPRTQDQLKQPCEGCSWSHPVASQTSCWLPDNDGAAQKWARQLQDWISPCLRTSDGPRAFRTSPWRDM